nr:MAG TPA: hypothetical protein [Caudoviricetes sp.]
MSTLFYVKRKYFYINLRATCVKMQFKTSKYGFDLR